MNDWTDVQADIHRDIDVCVCLAVGIQIVNPHYVQIPYLHIHLLTKFICNPEIHTYCAFLVISPGYLWIYAKWRKLSVTGYTRSS